MSNPLFQQFGQQQMPQNVPNVPNNFMSQLQQFGKMVQGDPRQIIQSLIQSGRMTQDQFNQYSQMANQILGRR